MLCTKNRQSFHQRMAFELHEFLVPYSMAPLSSDSAIIHLKSILKMGWKIGHLKSNLNNNLMKYVICVNGSDKSVFQILCPGEPAKDLIEEL